MDLKQLDDHGYLVVDVSECCYLVLIHLIVVPPALVGDKNCVILLAERSVLWLAVA